MTDLFRFLSTAALILVFAGFAIFRPTFGEPPNSVNPVNQVPDTTAVAVSPEAPADSPAPPPRPAAPPAEASTDTPPAADGTASPPSAPVVTATPAAEPPAQPPTPSDDSTLNGVDVSHYQGNVDWPKVAQSGVGFAIMKATEGVTYVDPKFATNLSGVQSAGLIYGAYHFYEPSDDAVQQAEHFMKTTALGAGWLPAILDLERSGSDVASYQKDVQAWLDHVETQSGCRPMIYASPSFWTSWLGPAFDKYQYYLAEYASKPRPPSGRSWVIWQHSQTGHVQGIDGNVDLDVFRGTAADMKTLLCGG